MINELKSEEARVVDPMQLNILTLERNAVLVARVAKKSGYDYEELSALRKILKDVFPNHEVFVWYDDIDFVTIHDNGYPSERMSRVNNDNNYGY